MSEELVKRLRDTNGGWASDEALAAADRIEDLEAENARLRRVVKRMEEGWGNALELDIIDERHRTSAKILREEARAALQDKGKQND